MKMNLGGNASKSVKKSLKVRITRMKIQIIKKVIAMVGVKSFLFGEAAFSA